MLGWVQCEQINTGSVFMSSKQAKSLILKQINLQQRLYTNLQEVSQKACKLTTRHTKHGKSCLRVLLRSYMPSGWNAFYFYFCFESKSRFQSSCVLLQSYRSFPVDLVTFTEEILNGKLHFLCTEFQNCCLSLVNPVSSIHWQVARELIF